MTVIVANDTPDAIRGMLKRWFVEPRPNVFIGTLNPRTHGKVVDYITRNSPKEFGMLINLSPSHYSEVINGLRDLPIKSVKRAFAIGVPAEVLLSPSPLRGEI